ncbi:MAG: hypothetical protein ACLFUJ_10295 [Phycisphaerae bacterium]
MTIDLDKLDPAVQQALHQRAQRQGISVDQLVQTLLTEAVGTKGQEAGADRDDFSEFSGLWSQEQFEEFEKNTADFEVIDPQEWK